MPAAVLLAVALFLAPSFTAPGGEFDEGFLLAYPDRVLEGAWPHRDFETFYGPASPVVLAGAYGLLGASVELERSIGLLTRLIAVLAVFLIALPRGRAVAALCALVAGVVPQVLGLAATAVVSAFALNLLGLALLVRAVVRGRGPGLALAAGLLTGVALLFRVDLVLAGVLGSLPLLGGLGAPERRRWAAGVLAGLLALIVHALVVGPDLVERVVGDLLRTGEGRRIAPPALASFGGLLMLLSAAGVALLASLALPAARRRDPQAARIGLAAALFTVGLIPYFAGRPDLVHLVLLASIAIGLAPLALLAHGSEAAPGITRRAERLVAPVAVAFGALIGLLGTVALASGTGIIDLTGRGSTDSVEVHHRGRSFPVKPENAADIQAMLDAAPRFAKPGDRLFAGERDLRQANGSDTVLYYLLDEFEPASYYMELNPQTANRRGSVLADELRRADVLILTSRYDEPDASGALVGGTEAPDVVAAKFCRRAGKGTYVLLTRCR